MNKAFIITLSKIESSISTAKEMIEPLNLFGFDVNLFEGAYGNEITELFIDQKRQLHPVDHNGKETKRNRKTSGPGAMGCFYSHYKLWEECLALDETIWIFEDDIAFIRPYYPVQFDEILITVVGSWTSIFAADPYQVLAKEPCALAYPGVCLPGTPGYAITPVAAKKLIDAYKDTYTASDSAIRASIVNIKLHSHLMGRALVEEDGKISLTKLRDWNSNK
jgi:GR25 family glycosyltransferase involved in LPS biosynthesis